MFDIHHVLWMSISLVMLVGVLLALFLCTDVLAYFTGDG